LQRSKPALAGVAMVRPSARIAGTPQPAATSAGAGRAAGMASARSAGKTAKYL